MVTVSVTFSTAAKLFIAVAITETAAVPVSTGLVVLAPGPKKRADCVGRVQRKRRQSGGWRSLQESEGCLVG